MQGVCGGLHNRAEKSGVLVSPTAVFSTNRIQIAHAARADWEDLKTGPGSLKTHPDGIRSNFRGPLHDPATEANLWCAGPERPIPRHTKAEQGASFDLESQVLEHAFALDKQCHGIAALEALHRLAQGFDALASVPLTSWITSPTCRPLGLATEEAERAATITP